MTVADVDVVDVRVSFQGEEEADEVGGGEQEGHCVHQGSVGHGRHVQCHRGLAWVPQGGPLHQLGMEEMRVQDRSPSGGQRGDLEGCRATTQPMRCHPTVGTTLSPPQQILTGHDCSRGCRCSPSAERAPVNRDAEDKGQPRCHRQEQELRWA